MSRAPGFLALHYPSSETNSPSLLMTRLHLHRLLVFLLLSCAALPATGQETFRKVLILGNSITKHGPKADIDWSGN